MRAVRSVARAATQIHTYQRSTKVAKFKLLGFTKPAEGREDEYNQWYSETHLPDLLKIPGIVTAQRFRLSKTQKPADAQPWKYLAIYDCDADDPQQIIDGIASRAGTAQLPISSALAEDRYVCYFEPITEMMHAKD